MDSYDYVIVGAGSAGCVLANKLGQDKKHRILVLEAGPMDYNLMIHIPAGVYKAYRNPKTNWNYLTEDEPELFNRKVPMPRGKVVGGSSSINSMVYMRGHPLDYDRWQSEFGLKEWSYDQCLPYFKEGENSDRGEDEWRGGSGNLGVSKGSFENPLFEAFEEAGRQSGQGYSEDLNGYNPEGIARLDATRKNGRRCSAAVAHLRPALARGIKWVFTKKGIGASNIWEAGGLIRSSSKAAYPDIQYHFGPVGFEYEDNKISLLQAFAIHVDQLRPRSRGEVTLKSADPLEKPLMTFNYLQHSEDLAEMLSGVKKARELISQQAFDEYRGEELIPGPEVESDEDLVKFIRDVAETDYHPSCSCAMGNSKMAVVDEQMKVHGVNNLRVVDASVMPQIISGNLNAPTQMIAARAADMILGKEQLSPIKASFAFND